MIFPGRPSSVLNLTSPQGGAPLPRGASILSEFKARLVPAGMRETGASRPLNFDSNPTQNHARWGVGVDTGALILCLVW